MHLASFNGWTEVVRLLLEKGASTDIKTNDGSTPVDQATSEGNIDIVCLFLEHGTNADAESTNVRVSLHLSSHEVRLTSYACY